MKAESIERRQRKRRPAALKAKTLSQVLTQGIVALEDYLLALKLDSSNYGEELRRTSHALSTMIGTYYRGLEVSDFETRIDQLQRMINELTASETLKRTRVSDSSVETRPVN